MWEDDPAARAAGIELLEARPGFARVRMRVRREHVNAVGICHGGYIFLLADTAFAFGCNSRNQKAVSVSAYIDFIAPGALDDVLTAECVELHLAGRSGNYDVRVVNQDGSLLALFRGRSTMIRGQYLPDEPPAGTRNDEPGDASAANATG